MIIQHDQAIDILAALITVQATPILRRPLPMPAQRRSLSSRRILKMPRRQLKTLRRQLKMLRRQLRMLRRMHRRLLTITRAHRATRASTLRAKLLSTTLKTLRPLLA